MTREKTTTDRQRMHIPLPSSDAYAFLSWAWPHVFERRYPRVISFQVDSEISLSQLPGLYEASPNRVVFKLVFQFTDYVRRRRSFRHWDEDDDSPTIETANQGEGTVYMVWDHGDTRCWGVQPPGKPARVNVSGGEYADLDQVRKFIDNLMPSREVREGAVEVSFTYSSDGHTANSAEREISVNKWADIRSNYSARIVDLLDQLINLEPAELAGKIAILHGPPGTGKTHFIRALANAWKEWASIKYIMDVERFFGEPGYMLDVVLHGPAKRWNVILCEDAEEFITPDSKHNVGQGLARLLNMGDGLVGQGLQIMLLFTTNAPVGKLHPAITRAGRCFANIEIPLLNAAEATQWLGGSQIVTKPLPLGELYEMKAHRQITSESPKRAGFEVKR